MNELETFPVQEFYEALMSSSDLQEKLEIILREIKTKNIQMTYQAIVHIHQILNSKLQPPLMKFNALKCVKIFFDTCEYSLILFIEVYLLPIIFQIAAFKATKKSEEGLSLYFIERGAQPTKQVKRLGFNYVSLSVELISATSQVKMYRVLQNEELQEESNFKKIAKALIMRGVPQITSYKFYNGAYIEQTRRIYVQKLQVFNSERFVDFMTDLIFGELVEDKHLELDSKRLIMYGDVYIISPCVNRIQQELNQMNGNFEGKRKILGLFFQLIRFGYAEAILLLNSSQFLTNITSEISKVNGDKDMDEGRLIYQQIDDNQKAKKLFYLEFLKCIETWSHAVPLNEHNEQSDAKRVYNFLKYQKKFKFPDNTNMHKYKSQMQIYLRQNKQRNEKVISIINNREESSKSQAKSRYKISSLKDESNIKTNQKKGTMEFEELQEIVINTMTILEVIGFQEKRYEKQMKRLLKFKQSWKENLEMVKKKVYQDDEPFNLDMLISEGEIVYQQVLGLENIYLLFKDNKINFLTAQEKINILLNQLDEQNLVSQVSVSAKSRNTRLTNRRDLKSKISQKARDRSISDHSKYSKNSRISQSKSAKMNTKITRPNANHNQELPIPKVQNPINETFALNQQEKSLSYSNKRANGIEKPIQVKKVSSHQNTKKQNLEFSTQKINEQGVEHQYRRDNQPSTATFIPTNNSGISLKLTTQNNEIPLTSSIKNLKNQNSGKNTNRQVIEKFQDSFEVKRPFNKKIKKDQEFEKVLFTSEDENYSSCIMKNSIHHKQQKIKQQRQDNDRKKHKKNSLIKKILSSDKIAFNKNETSQSEEEQFPIAKVQKNIRNNKLSRYTSFNNGNVSGYFNEQSLEEYGFNGNIKESIKNQPKIQKNASNSSHIHDLTDSRANKKNIIVKFDESQLKIINLSQKSSKNLSNSRQISEIQAVQNQLAQHFDDFNLANPKKQMENQTNSMKKQSLLKSRIKESQIKPNFNDSRYSEVCKLNLTQKIKDDESFQMIQSHYKTKEIEQKMFDVASSNKDSKFRQILEVKKQIIHDRNGILSPFNHEQSDKRKNRLDKMVKLQNINLKNSTKRNNLMEVLSERSAKKGIEDYLIEKEKNNLIKKLNLRIKRLQNEEATIQTKLSKKDEELRSISYKNYSERQQMKFKSENTSQGSMQNSIKDNESSNTSLYFRLSPKNPEANRLNNIAYSETNTLPQNYVDLSAYDKFLENLYDNTFKKNCLRNKSLILANEEMQIGCMSIKKDKFINFTLFLTPKVLPLQNVRIAVQPNENLSINVYPDNLYSIKVKKQQTINVRILVQNVPFSIPKLIIEYQLEPNIKFKSNSPTNNIQKSSFQLTLPCTFHKICLFQSINVKDFYNMFNSGEFKDDIRTCKKFKINSKIFKEQKMKEFFPYLTLLKKVEDANRKMRAVYGFQVNYNGNVFLMLVKVEDQKYAKLDAKNMTGESKTQKFLEFFMATFKKFIAY